jgi:hypothetical protein
MADFVVLWIRRTVHSIEGFSPCETKTRGIRA